MEPFDFWFAVNNTHVLETPNVLLETFGATMIDYQLISQLMDSTQVRIREGKLEARRPEILTPDQLSSLPLEGFNEGASEAYARWLADHGKDLHMLRYGFIIRKTAVNDHVVSDPLELVIDNVRQAHQQKKDPYAAVILGVDEPWEVCLIKLMVDLVEKSMPSHVEKLSPTLNQPSRHQSARETIETAFEKAALNEISMESLYQLLKTNQVFEQYEDRFFSLVKQNKKD